MNTFTGTGTLLRFALRRDRVRIAVWLAALSLGTVWISLALTAVYPTAADRQTAAASVSSPAGLAFTGPAHYFSDYTLGAIISHQILGFVAILVGIMSVLMVVRHTRTEEETGRAELVRAGIVGRHAPLTSAVLLTILVNLALMLLLVLLLPLIGDESITWSGSLLYGAAHAAVGITFAGIAAVTTQFSASSRGASGLGMALVGAAYLLRAAGDAAGSDSSETLSWLSPIGWAQRTFPYLDDRWWPLALNLAAGIVLAGLGLLLSERRDRGAGMRAARRGRSTATAGLRTPIGVALRLHRGMFIGFAIGLVLLGMSYGPFLGDIETTFRDVELIDDALSAIGGATLVDGFLTMLATILAVVATIYSVTAVFRARSEESSGRAEPVLATWQSRPTFLGTHLIIGLIGGPLILVLCALMLGITGEPTVAEPVLGKAVAAAAVHIPALWVFAGLAAVLVGWLPKATSLAWAAVTYAGFVGYLGPLLQLPDWTNRFSPFGYVPNVPAEDFALAPLIGLTVVAAALIAIGFVGFRRRDLETK